jgi:hypothetical protein
LAVTAAAYLIPIRAPGSATRVACCQYSAKITTVASFPGEERTFGNGAVTVDWTEDQPWQAYVSALELPTGIAISGIDATIRSSGTFVGAGDTVCYDQGTVAGSVNPAPRSDGTFADSTTMAITWDAPFDPQDGCLTGGVGQAKYGIDPASG